MNSPRFHCRRSAFTLIELLTVITIIAILAAILVPVAGNIRNRANQTTSINNLRQWGSALAASLSEFDGSLPTDGSNGGSADTTDEDAWFNRLPRYLGEKPLKDPEHQTKPPRLGDKSVWINPGVKVTDANKNIFVFCYAMNDYLSSKDSPTIKMTRIERSTATVFMSERGDAVPTVVPKEVQAHFGGGDPVSALDNEANFLFCDGHIASMKRKDFQNPDALKTDPIDPNYTFIPFPEAVKD